MLWIVLKSASYQITSANMIKKDGKHELWVERTNGKGLKLLADTDIYKVVEIKDAIDYAIKTRESTLELEL